MDPSFLSSVDDFANRAHDQIGRYKLEVTLSPGKLKTDEFEIDKLEWNSICYGKEELEKVPDNRRGLYAFAICRPNDILPPHGYILYIGIAGRDSNRSLRARYRDYLNEKKILKRSRIALMIGTWREVLRFYFAPVENDFTTERLQTLERQLNTALLPTFSRRDLDANVRKIQRAFK